MESPQLRRERKIPPRRSPGIRTISASGHSDFAPFRRSGRAVGTGLVDVPTTAPLIRCTVSNRVYALNEDALPQVHPANVATPAHPYPTTDRVAFMAFVATTAAGGFVVFAAA